MINEKDTVAGGCCICGCGDPGMEPLQMYFSVIYRHGRVMHDKAMKQFGLTGQQMGYLKNINAAPGLSQEELAKQMHIDKGARKWRISTGIQKRIRDQKTQSGRQTRILSVSDRKGRGDKASWRKAL